MKHGDGETPTRSPRTAMKEKRVEGMAFLDAQKKFMEVAKKRAASQEKFLVEAEDMKGKVSCQALGELPLRYVCSGFPPYTTR